MAKGRCAKATFTDDELAEVRCLVHERDVKGAATELALAPGTIFRVLSGLPVSNLTASHLRMRLAARTAAQPSAAPAGG
jgi:hypothetical protein